MNKTSLVNHLNIDCNLIKCFKTLNHKPSISDFLECSKYFKKENIYLKHHTD